ncbi:beta-ketoacyl-ACP synthase 3 [Candidatus Woesearchaeota archaeon]|nr:beta-ketoacyl-ACP synthase 3 [Candidatus Woesearchaeota archaeon]
MGVTIYGPGVHIPETVLTNADLEKLVDTSDEWIFSRTGMRERRISLDKGVREMGTLAVYDLMSRVPFSPEEIDEIILATNVHDGNRTFPAHAALIAGDIGARKGIPAYDQILACTGLVGAIRTGYNNIIAGVVDKLLVLGAERISKFTDYADRHTCVLFGDGAGAYLLQRSEEEGVIKNVLGSEPDMGGKGWPNGYLTTEKREGLQIVSKNNGEFQTEKRKKNYLIMDGGKVLKFAARVMKQSVLDVLEGTGYSLEDVDVVLPHGANIRIVNAAKKGLEKEGLKGVVFHNLERYGNTSTASVPLAAAEAKERGIIKEGSLVVNVAFGAGFTYGANLYRARFSR